MKVSKIFVTSDTHFNHTNIIKYCNRPFKDIDEMNEELIKKWNEVVSNEDIVYHLGDFGFIPKNKLQEICKQLNGYKILIMGNHDYRGGRNFYKELGFNEVYRKKLIVDDKYIFTHYPIKVEYDEVNVFGHIHEKTIPNEFNDGKHICVCVDKWDFYPISLDKIVMRKQKVKKSADIV